MNTLIKGIIFDLDGTLFNRDLVCKRALCSLMPLANEQTIQRALRIDNSGYGNRQELLEFIAAHADEHAHLECLKLRFQNSLKQHMRYDPDLVHMLKNLSLRYKIGMVTNGSQVMQQSKLDILKIGGFFNPCLISEECGMRKPNQDIFNSVLTSWALDSEQVLMVGDHEENDIIGAKSCGLQTARVSMHTSETSADIQIDSIHQLQGILK